LKLIAQSVSLNL